MRNLVIGVVGDNSLHKYWLSGCNPEFDLFLVYYADLGERYRSDGVYYDTAKGTKFLIVDQMVKKHKEVFDHYDAILIPDDDLLIDARGINRFFDLFHQYELAIAQPAIMGWLSLQNTQVSFENILRYVRCVEIMTPCFSREAFQLCKHTFSENKTNWGIDWLWWGLLGEPKDKLAIIDDVVAIHTRPCFFGDTYWRNKTNFDIALGDLKAIKAKHQILDVNEVYGSVPRKYSDWEDQPSESKKFPNSPIFYDILSHILASNIVH